MLAGPKFHICSRYPESKPSLTPGPANYSPDYKKLLKSVTHKYSICGRRGSTGDSTVPGPGAYNIVVHRIKVGGIFARDKRRPLSQSCIAIGPGQYTPEPVLLSSPRIRFFSLFLSYRFGTASKLQVFDSRKIIPGPGAYNLCQILGKEGTKSTIIPKRPDTAPYPGRGSPGPGAYNTTHSSRGSSYKIGTAPRGRIYSESIRVPGPGAYSPEDKRASQRPSSPGWAYFLRILLKQKELDVLKEIQCQLLN